jgi:hypothetical protein
MVEVESWACQEQETIMDFENVFDSDYAFTILETRRWIDEINNNLNLTFSDREIKTMIYCMLRGGKGIQFDLSDFSILRARRLRDPFSPFAKPNEMMAPPAELVRSYGRCNMPGQAVFYGACNLNTMFAEIRAEVGDFVQFIELKIDEGKSVTAGFSGLFDYYRRHEAAPHLFSSSDELSDLILRMEKELSEHVWVRSLLVDAFVADRFRRVKRTEESDKFYNVTAAYTNHVFENENDALVYPSVAHLGGWNMALKPEVSLERFRIFSAGVYKITRDWGYGLYEASRVRDVAAVSPTGFRWAD